MIERSDLIAAAQQLGAALRDPPRRHEPAATRGIGEVRGRGLMQAIELVQPGTTQPDPERVRAVARHLPRPGRRHPVRRHLRQRHPLPSAPGHQRASSSTRASTSWPRPSPPPADGSPAPAQPGSEQADCRPGGGDRCRSSRPARSGAGGGRGGWPARRRTRLGRRHRARVSHVQLGVAESGGVGLHAVQPAESEVGARRAPA